MNASYDILPIVVILLSGIGIGIIIGFFITLRAYKVGTLVIDFSDPDIDRASIVMETPLVEVSKKRWVALKIRNKYTPYNDTINLE